MEGDLRISNERSFQNAEDNKVEGSQGDGETLVFSRYPHAAYANDRVQGTHDAPTLALLHYRLMNRWVQNLS
jgi:hypothetical protein